jgi:NAD+--asparagine ADP-ribosyltransferase
MADPKERWQKLYNMEHDKGATDNEKKTARKLREKLETKHPDTRQSWRERRQSPTTQGECRQEKDPGPYDAGEGRGSPVADDSEGWRGAAAKATEWLRSAVSEAAKGITINQLARDYTDVEIEGNTKTIHIHVRIPVDVVSDLYETQGSDDLQEYARLVGLIAGTELAEALRESGY